MIRKLAVTATQIKATVAIGTDEWGGHVTTDVVLPRKHEEVQAAMVTLENLCLRTAQTHVRTARDRRELDQLVERGIGAKLGKERDRLVRDATAAADRKAQEAERVADAERAKFERSQREQSELRTRIDNQAAELMRLRTQLAEQEGQQ